MGALVVWYRSPKNGAPGREKPELIADELRSLIVSGALRDGASLGRESDLVDRFGVSRPSLREALRIIEPAAARMVAAAKDRCSASAAELRELIEVQRQVIDDPLRFGKANAQFHERLVALAGNQTLQIVAEMLNEIVERAVTVVSKSSAQSSGSLAVRRRGLRSQERLVELIAVSAGNEAEVHWRTHMEEVGKVILGQRATRIVDLIDHY